MAYTLTLTPQRRKLLLHTLSFAKQYTTGQTKQDQLDTAELFKEVDTLIDYNVPELNKPQNHQK